MFTRIAMKKEQEKIEESDKSLILPIEESSIEISTSIENLKGGLEEYYGRLLVEDLEEEAKLKAESLKRASTNLSKSARELYKIEDELSGRLLDVRQERVDNRLISAPANATIDLKEKELNHFAQGLNLYKLLLVCFIGSFIGVIIEMAWCFARHGYIESRAGLVYGPFNLVYGIGALTLTIFLFKYRNRGILLSFLGGMIVGSVVEYACSWAQEFMFGSSSWDYSNMIFHLNGRINLLYSIFWGLLGVLWIKNLYPRMAKWILKIPNKIGKNVTWLLLVFFIINASMSTVAVTRWAQRTENIEPFSKFGAIIDERFPDDRMERVYANMVFE